MSERPHVADLVDLEPRRRGRPSSFTPAARERVLAAIEAGVTMAVAATHGGISRSSLYAYLDRGRRERERIDADEDPTPRPSERDYLDFLDAAEVAQATLDVVAATTIYELMIDPNVDSAVRARVAIWTIDRHDRARGFRRGEIVFDRDLPPPDVRR